MNHVYVYSWSSEDYRDRTEIRAYGIDEENRTIALIISDFTPYVYIELPCMNWKAVHDDLVRDLANKTLLTKVVEKEHLYASRGKKRFLFCQCASQTQISFIAFHLKKTPYYGNILEMHEDGASSILQLTSLRDIPMSTWICYEGNAISPERRVTAADVEIEVKWRKLFPCDTIRKIVHPKVLAFDLEVNSDVMNAMPSNKPGDVIFQISCVIEQTTKRKLLLTLKGDDLDDDNPLLDGIEVMTFDNEEELLCGFINLLRDERPNVLAGYNILMFDIPYVTKRCERYGMLEEFQLAGFNRISPAQQKTIKWSSSAYKNQEYIFIDWEGILIIDLLPIIRRDYKLANYKLDTVATTLIGAEKDPVGYKEIFRAYRERKMARVGKYCVQDSNLCVDIMNHIHCWITLAEMSVVCKVSMFSSYTQGQQLKIYNQVYAHCLRKNIIVTSNGSSDFTNHQRYVGGYVMDPIPGRYDMVCPLDFCSLYPSIIIAYNICYSTFVPHNSNVPDSHCQIFEWEDHIGCEHDPRIIEISKLTRKIENLDRKIKLEMQVRDATVGASSKKMVQDRINDLRSRQKPIRMKRANLKKSNHKDRENDDGSVTPGIICCVHRYRFLKKEIKKGVIPAIIQNLLDSRKSVKEYMKTCSGSERIVQDKRQLALKVSANSQYGAMGVRRHGRLPLPQGARCITYLGRQAITKAGNIICEKYGGKWIYTDTDSTYVSFPHLSTPREIWDHAVYVARKVSEEFAGLTIEFEEAIYKSFLILSKKRYVYNAIDREGVSDGKIGNRGVVLTRRDNSKYLRTVYSAIVDMIFAGKTQTEIEIFIIEYISDMFRKRIDVEQYVITKSIRSTEGEQEFGRLGDYKVKKLPIDEIEKKMILDGKTERQYFIDSCPFQVKLAERMKNRGFPVDAGSRMEFVVLKSLSTKSATMGDRVEDFDYFLKRKNHMEIDYLYYLKSLVNPLDQLLEVGIGIKSGFISKQLEYRINHSKILSELKNSFVNFIIKR